MTHEKLFIDKAKQLFPVMFQSRTPDECWIWGAYYVVCESRWKTPVYCFATYRLLCFQGRSSTVSRSEDDV
jgi:hypothetical protein